MSPSLLRPPRNHQAPAVFRTETQAADLAIFVLKGEQRDELKSEADKLELLRQLRAGEPIFVEVKAITYTQGATPNRKYVRFSARALQALTKSFVGKPVLRNHDQHATESRGGIITGAELEKQGDGEYALHMTLRLVKPWAVESLLDGTMTFFSIGFRPTGPVHCSVHGKNVRECGDWPGDRIMSRTGERTVEWEFQSADGLEVSDVNVPAAAGTGIESARQLAGDTTLDATSLWSMLAHDHSTETKETTMDLQKLLAELGLGGVEMTFDQIVEACKKLRASGDEVTLLREQLTAARTELEASRKAAADAEAAKTKQHVETQLGRLKAAGKLKPGSESETALRRMADRSLSVFDGQVEDLLTFGASVTAAGGRQSEDAGGVKPVIQTVDEVLAADPALAMSLARAGISKADFELHGLPLYLARKAAGAAAGV